MIHNWENYFDTSSEYWEKVEKIYEENESFPKKVVKERNLHHKFPRSFSKKDGAEIDNDEDNLVSLSLADHFRVHYYLWKCSKKGYRGMMAKAFVFMRKKMVVYATDETIEQLAKDYENAIREAAEASSKAMKGEKNSMYGKKHSEEAKKKISAAHKGEKNSFYGRHHTKESKKKMSEAQKGKHLGKENPFYGKHHSEEARKKIGEAQKGENNHNYGKHLSEETKKKLSEAMKGNKYHLGKHWYNNGKINIRAKECPPGFVSGMLK